MSNFNIHHSGPSAAKPSKALPQSLEAEQGVLSCCFYEDENIIEKALRAGLRKESFYFPANAQIFARLADMKTRRVPVSLLTLVEELKSTNELASVGNVAYLMELTKVQPTTAQVDYLISKVRDLSVRRDLIRAAEQIAEDGYGTIETSELIADTARRITSAIGGRKGQNDWPLRITSESLVTNLPPTPPVLIKGIMYQGGTMLLSGPSKSHKTFTALDVAIAIAGGTDWLNFPTAKCPVLYLNLELQDFATAHRIRDICVARGVQPPKELYVWNLRGKKVTLGELMSRLGKEIVDCGAKAVCIDPHYKVSSISGMEENSNDDQGRLLAELESICATSGASLILTHHFAKGDASSKNAIDRASGGGVFARWGDVMLTFTPHEEDDAMTVEMSLRNFAPVKPFVVKWECPCWVRDAELNPEDLKTTRGPKKKHDPQDLMETLGDGLMGFAEWERKAGMSKSTFKRLRKELLDSGMVLQIGNQYRKAK